MKWDTSETEAAAKAKTSPITPTRPPREFEKPIKVPSHNHRSATEQADAIVQKKRDKLKATAAKLHEAADTLAGHADEDMNRDRLDNTAKRARQAASAVGRAMADEAMAKTMHAVAEHLESGEAEHLTGVSQKTHLEALDAALRSARHKRFKDNYSEFERRQYDPYTDDDIKFAEWPWPARSEEHTSELQSH